MLLTVTALTATSDEPAPTLKPSGRLHERIREASGLCKSRRHAGVFWTISDSGNPPKLYAITRAGQLLAEFDVRNAINLDWESIDTDDDGNLWIGDVGNNLPGGPLKVRWVYQVREPNPFLKPIPRENENDFVRDSIPIERQIHYQFPGEPRDVEGMFVRRQTLYLVSKRKESPTELFRCSLSEAVPSGRDRGDRRQPRLLADAGRLPRGLRVTGTALDPDAKRLAFCSYDHVTMFALPNGLDSLPQLAECESHTLRFPPTEVEGCEWDGDDVVLISEDRNMYCVPWRCDRH